MNLWKGVKSDYLAIIQQLWFSGYMQAQTHQPGLCGDINHNFRTFCAVVQGIDKILDGLPGPLVKAAYVNAAAPLNLWSFEKDMLFHEPKIDKWLPW